jgi:nucleotide-binding universal stress UspA family protein
MIRNLFVPVDGSAFSEHSLPLAFALARKSNARVCIARVHELFPPAYGGSVEFAGMVDDSVKVRENSYLDDLRRRLPADVVGRTTVELLDGDIIPTLKERADAADLVVMTTHGHGPLARFWLGSVADELPRVVRTPVLLVRPGHFPVDLHADLSVKQILVTLDGSKAAEEILRPVTEVATLTGARVLLVKVVAPLLIEGGHGSRHDDEAHGPTLLDELRQEQRSELAKAEAYLASVAARLVSAGLTLRSRVLLAEKPAVAILREAEIAGADMIALATHGRRGLPRLLIGSVADKLIRGTNLSILLSRQHSE